MQLAMDEASNVQLARESLMRATTTNNVFAKILRGEIPSQKVYEDADTLAIMDIMPRCPGIRWSFRRRRRATCSMPIRRCWQACDDRAEHGNAVKEAFNADGVTLMQFNEPAGGQMVFHLHFHVMPRLKAWRWCRIPQHGKARGARRHAEKIRKALKD